MPRFITEWIILSMIRKFPIVSNVYQLFLRRIQRRKKAKFILQKILISRIVLTLVSSLEARASEVCLKSFLSRRRYFHFQTAPNKKTLLNESLILVPRSGQRQGLFSAG